MRFCGATRLRLWWRKSATKGVQRGSTTYSMVFSIHDAYAHWRFPHVFLLYIHSWTLRLFLNRNTLWNFFIPKSTPIQSPLLKDLCSVLHSNGTYRPLRWAAQNTQRSWRCSTYSYTDHWRPGTRGGSLVDRQSSAHYWLLCRWIGSRDSKSDAPNRSRCLVSLRSHEFLAFRPRCLCTFPIHKLNYYYLQ